MCAGHIALIINVKLSMRLCNITVYRACRFWVILNFSHLTLIYSVYDMIEN